MPTRLGDMSLGSSIIIPTSAGNASFIIVYQGTPSSAYYNASGTWILMNGVYSTRISFDSDNNDYAGSTLDSWLDTTFWGMIASNARAAIKTVRIPYYKGTGSSGSVASGSSGLARDIFAPSLTECGWVASDGSSSAVLGTRIARVNSNANIGYIWWLRDPRVGYSNSAWYVKTESDATYSSVTGTAYPRPMMVLNSNYLYESGTFSTNSAPTISSSFGTSLGTLTNGFEYSYSVNDSDGDMVSVTEYYDNVKQDSFYASLGTTYVMDNTSEDNWQSILNGSHSYKITAADTYDTSTRTTTFTKKVTKCLFTMKEPIALASSYSQLDMYVEGSIPSDANFTVEVTTNGTSDSPTWTDITSYVLNEETYTFPTTSALATRYFNFRVTASRGSSDTAGYITRVWGTFVRPQSDE